MTTFTKLKDGSWGLRSTEPLSTGQRVQVSKMSGQISMETVGKIVWSGEGVTIATIAGKEEQGAARSSRGGSRGGSAKRRERLSDDDRCEVCNGNKWTCGHCVGW